MSRNLPPPPRPLLLLLLLLLLLAQWPRPAGSLLPRAAAALPVLLMH